MVNRQLTTEESEKILNKKECIPIAGANTKVSDAVNFSYNARLTQTSNHSSTEASAFRVDQLVQKASVNYDPTEAIQLNLSGEHYVTSQQGNPDLKYFFADASVKYRALKWKKPTSSSAPTTF